MSELIVQATVDATGIQRLLDLASQYEITKAQAEEAAARHEEIKLQLKSELWARAPDVTSAGAQLKDLQMARIDLWVPEHAPFQLTAQSKWRIDSKAMKVGDPKTYARWAKRSITWSLTHGAS